jgi:pyruvate,orthophosphate dikinase
MLGAVETIQPVLSGDFETVMTWADETRRMKVRTNAETPLDAQTAVDFGAEGIGLCRTEHMFFDPDRIQHVREMIFATDQAGREKSLAKLLPAQRDDFTELFKIMAGKPVTIRLLDPPLHEFLPQTMEDIEHFTKTAGLDADFVTRRQAELHESNPMLGHRGCRLAITYPEICAMQARAIFEAAVETDAIPEVMVPLIIGKEELKILKNIVIEQAEAVFAEKGKKVEYLVGTMIEIPRAALMADDIATEAEFFSFGTNDLTQTTMGMSRDDASKFLPDYIDQGILEKDPFQTLDKDGVGQLVDMAAQRGRSTRADIKLGVCGEHGGDPSSIAFFEQVGLDYISCSPYRVPIARLAAAQEALKQGKKSKAALKQAA